MNSTLLTDLWYCIIFHCAGHETRLERVSQYMPTITAQKQSVRPKRIKKKKKIKDTSLQSGSKHSHHNRGF